MFGVQLADFSTKEDDYIINFSLPILGTFLHHLH